MSEVAEDNIDGTVYIECGCFFQDPNDEEACYTHGYPVACKRCFRAGMRRRGVQKAVVKSL